MNDKSAHEFILNQILLSKYVKKTIAVSSETTKRLYAPQPEVQSFGNYCIGAVKMAERIDGGTKLEVFVQVAIPVDVDTDHSTLHHNNRH